MGAGGVAGSANLRDGLPLFYSLPFLYQQLAAMGVKGRKAVLMVKDKIIAVAFILAGLAYCSRQRRADGSAFVCG